MKLTNNTTPQARNYQCTCGAIKCHADMYDDNLCYDCWDEEDANCTNSVQEKKQ